MIQSVISKTGRIGVRSWFAVGKSLPFGVPTTAGEVTDLSLPNLRPIRCRYSIGSAMRGKIVTLPMNPEAVVCNSDISVERVRTPV
jgi:hypothetical protein